MKPVDYEQIAASYNRRYAVNDFGALADCVRGFLDGAESIAEVGCGTGHWLSLAASLPQSPYVVGLDRAFAMLGSARARVPDVDLIRGTADELPWRPAAFDRVYCVNALHHFPDRIAFYRECARVLRADGAFMTIGLDPHTGEDQWWIYDYFPGALTADRKRYPSTQVIRTELTAAGFSDVETFVAQHLPARMTFDEASARGVLERSSTSQLLVIDDAEWTSGMRRLLDEKPDVYADLRLYATIGWRCELSGAPTAAGH